MKVNKKRLEAHIKKRPNSTEILFFSLNISDTRVLDRC